MLRLVTESGGVVGIMPTASEIMAGHMVKPMGLTIPLSRCMLQLELNRLSSTLTL